MHLEVAYQHMYAYTFIVKGYLYVI